MSRPALGALGIGALAAVAIVLLALSGSAVMPSYLGGWLLILALPLGALPLVMGCELLDLPETRLTLMLRRLVAVMPAAAFLGIPVMLHLGTLYPSLGTYRDGLPAWWMTDALFLARAVLFLGGWTVLSFVFARPPGTGRFDARRPMLAAAGLGLHVVMGTLAAVDWAQAVEPSLNSSAFGLLLIAVWCSVAVSVAVLMTVVGRPEAEASRDLDATGHVGIALAVLLAGWGFITFTQYLVVWSANLPKEVIWYQHRAAGFGLAGEYCAGILCALAFVALLHRGLSRHAGILAWVAAGLLVMHGCEMMWLVTPAFRSAFTLTSADLLALAGAAGLGIGFALLLGERAERGGWVMARPEPKRWGTAALGGLLVALGAALFGAARGTKAVVTKTPGKTAAKPGRRHAGKTPNGRGAPKASGRSAAAPRPRVGRAKVRTKPKLVEAPARTRYWPPPAPRPIEPEQGVHAAEAAAQENQPVDRDSETLGYEVKDTTVGTIAKVIAFSVSMIVISIAALFWFIGHAHRDDARGPPLTRQQAAVIVPPSPRLQDHPLHDIAMERQRESDLLSHYAWTGPDHRTARIPIARAQALVTGRPLDPLPAPAVPAANP